MKEGDPLRTVMKEYFVDTNWLKLWTLNNALHSTLGTECLPGLDCDQDVGSLVAIDNPQLVLGTPSGTGKRILWAGGLSFRFSVSRARLDDLFPSFVAAAVS